MASNNINRLMETPGCSASDRAMEDVGDRPLFEVHDDLQSLVPTVNEFHNPTEPSKELQDLYDFERSLLNTKFTCQDCGSEAHVSGLCKQNEAAYNSQFLTTLEDIPAKEQAARTRLSRGVPQGALRCAHHGKQLQDTLHQRGEQYHPYSIIPGSSQGLITLTGLLPICDTCLNQKTLPHSGQPTPKLDTCLCATGIMASNCLTCAVHRVEGTKAIAAGARTRVNPDGSRVVTCECGQQGGNSTARVCAGCGGLVTLPTTNFAGETLIFRPDTADPTVIRSGPTAPAQSAASIPPATSSGVQQGNSGGSYRSVSSLLGSHVDKRHHDPPSQHAQHVSALAETAHLRAQGLHLPSSVFDAAYRALTDPRQRLQRLVDNLMPPRPALEHAAIGAILTTCGFGADELASVMETFNSVFSGRVSASNLALLVSYALNRSRQGGGQQQQAGGARENAPAAEPVEDTEMPDRVDW